MKIGSEEYQAQQGDTFQILVIVTDEALSLSDDNFLRFDRPLDVPGVAHISNFVNLVVGQR